MKRGPITPAQLLADVDANGFSPENLATIAMLVENKIEVDLDEHMPTIMASFPLLKQLIDYKFPMNQPQPSLGMMTPLMYALANDQYKAAKQLLDSGLDLNIDHQSEFEDIPNETALTIGIRKMQPELCEQLLAAGADPIEPDNKPLLCACLFGELEVAESLIAKGAKLTLNDALKVLDESQDRDELFNFLLKHSPKLLTDVVNGQSALTIAFELGNESLVTFLLDRGANPSLPNNKPLELALEGNAFGTATALFDKGARLTQNDYPLVLKAIENGYPSLDVYFKLGFNPAWLDENAIKLLVKHCRKDLHDSDIAESLDVAFEHVIKLKFDPLMLKEAKEQNKPHVIDHYLDFLLRKVLVASPATLPNDDFKRIKAILDSGVSAEKLVAKLLKLERFDLLKSLQPEDAKLPLSSNTKQVYREAIRNRDFDKVLELEALFEFNQGSPYVGGEHFFRAACHVGSHFYFKHYNNGISAWRWANQRAEVLVQYSDGSLKVFNAKAKDLIGVPEAQALMEEQQTSSTPKPVTLKDIAERAGVPESEIGKLDVKAFNASLIDAEGKQDGTVINVKYRTNHDLSHAMRTAATVSISHELFGKPESTQSNYRLLNQNQLEQLELMMLFSVVGREDETGFHDGDKGRQLYKTYRSVSAVEFFQFCIENWDSLYKQVFGDLKRLYQAALVIELMGYDDLDEDFSKSKTPPLFWLLMENKSDSEINQFQTKAGAINHHINAYPSDLFSSLKPQNLQLAGEKPITERISVDLTTGNQQLFYMNQAHQLDLMRCYIPGSLQKYAEDRINDKKYSKQLKEYKRDLAAYEKNKKPPKPEPPEEPHPDRAIFNMLRSAYVNALAAARESKKDRKEPVIDKVIDLFAFASTMMSETGQDVATTITTGEQLQKIKAQAVGLEKILVRNRKKNYDEIKNDLIKAERYPDLNITPPAMTIDAYLRQVLGDTVLELIVKKGDGKVKGFLKDIVPLSALTQLLLKDRNDLNPESFDFHVLREPGQVSRAVDPGNPDNVDVEASVLMLEKTIESIPRPAFAEKVKTAQYPGVDIEKLANMKK